MFGNRLYRFVFGVLVSPAILTSCTYMESRSIPAVSTAEPSKGLSYPLPMAQFALEAGWKLTECPDYEAILNNKDEATYNSENRLLLAPIFSASVEAKQDYIADPDAHFVLDYEALGGPTKTSSIDVEFFENGPIKTVNASVTDKSAEIAGALIRTGFKIARLAAGLPSADSPAITNLTESDTEQKLSNVTVVDCREETKKVLASVNDLKKKLKDITKELNDSSADLRLKQAAAAANVKTSSEGLEELEEAVKVNLKLSEEVNNVKKTLAKSEEYLTVRVSERWPNGGNDKKTTLLEFKADRLERLLTLKTIGLTPEQQSKSRPGTFENIVDDVRLVVDIGDGFTDAKLLKLETGKTYKGLIYRTPVNGRMRICFEKNTIAIQAIEKAKIAAATTRKAEIETAEIAAAKIKDAEIKVAKEQLAALKARDKEVAAVKAATDKAPSKNCVGVASKKMLADNAVALPQFGPAALLPLSNGPFEENTLSVSFYNSGRVNTFAYGEKSAPLEKFAAVLDGAADEALSFRDARRNAEVDALERRLKEVEAANKLQEALKAGIPDPNADEVEKIQAETAIIKAQIERLNVADQFSNTQVNLKVENDITALEAQIKTIELLTKINDLTVVLKNAESKLASPAD